MSKDVFGLKGCRDRSFLFSFRAGALNANEKLAA